MLGEVGGCAGTAKPSSLPQETLESLTILGKEKAVSGLAQRDYDLLKVMARPPTHPQ